MQSLYRQILESSWQIAWRQKWLWLFGFFAAFLGNGANIDIFFNVDALTGISPAIENLKVLHADGELLTFLTGLDSFLRTHVGSTLVVALLSIVIAFIFVWLITVSQISVIAAANKLSRKEKTNYTQIFAIGRQHFMRVLGLNAIAKIIVYGLLVALAAPLVARLTVSGPATIWEVLFAIVYTAFFIVASIVTFYATAAITLDGLDVPHAISRGWHVFRANWLINVEFALLLVGINILAALSFLVVLFLLAIPIFLLSLVFYFVASESGLFLVISVALLLLIVLVATFSALLATFQYSTWTLLYRELRAGRGIAKLIRLLAPGAGKS